MEDLEEPIMAETDMALACKRVSVRAGSVC